MPLSSLEPKDPLQVWDFKALPKGGRQEALALLHRVAKQVQPVMCKRGWRVPLLSEFSPKSPNLLGLNINGGGGNTSEIKIRLRPHNNEGSFFPYEHLLGTMLHELVHNVQGPHNAVFYKLLDEITEECEGFMAKGITGSGAGFDAPSMGRLGGRGPVPIHNPPAHQLKSAALKAAEARSKKQSLMPAGPRKLGGDLSLLKNLTPAQAAARAAERRARDNVWCPCGDHGTGIGYTNENGGVIILDNASSRRKQPDQRSSGRGSASQHSSSTSTQATMPGNMGGSSSVNVLSGDATLLAGGSGRTSLLDGSQVQRVHQGGRTAGGVASLDSHEKQEQPKVRQKLQHQPGDVNRSVARTKGGSKPGSSSSDLVDLTLDDVDVLPTHEPKFKRLRQQQHGTPHFSQTPTSEHVSVLDHAASADQQWPCSVCTLLNQDVNLQCCACSTLRPAVQCSKLSNGHSVHQPQPESRASSSASDTWSCKFCSMANAAASSHCSACTHWRYSYGAPHASRPTI